MYCGDCGAKNEKDSQFCQECGSRLEQAQKQEIVKVTTSPKKPMKKSTKIIIASVFIIFVVLFGTYRFVEDKLSPKSITESYVKALVENDTDKLYDYLSLDGDVTFVSKEAYQKVMKDSKFTEVENYKVLDANIAEGGLTASVTVKYTSKDSVTEREFTIDLAKQKDKKYFLFDNWKIVDSVTDTSVVENYEIKVVKDSEVYFDNKKVDKKYKSEELTSDYYDVYVLPQVFSVETEVKAVVGGGLEVVDSITPTVYYDSYTIDVDLDNLKDKVKEEIQTLAKDALTTIYKGVVENKEFSSIKSSFGEHDLTKLETSYNELIQELEESSSTLTKIEFTEVTLRDVELDDEGNIEVDIKASYNYSLKYVNFLDEEKTHDDKTSSYMTIVLKYQNNSYKIVDIEDLEDYFSRY